jgi:hypothetical protein
MLGTLPLAVNDQEARMPKMKAAVFIKAGRIVLDEKPIPDIGPLDGLSGRSKGHRWRYHAKRP